jgi:serine/threonine protein kinase
MQFEFDRTQSETFVDVARRRQLLSDTQAKTLLDQSTKRSVMPSQLAIELGVLQPVEVEIVEAFTDPKNLAPGYELLSVLGFGALGVVYRAHQAHLQRDVAIKAIKQSSLSQQNAIARFHQEGAAIGRLHHPNIVSAFDSGSHRNRLYLVMELVHGADLRHRLKRGPLDIATAISIVRQTASGLAHALSHQIIHRDIKPGNLILTDAPAGFDLQAGIPLVKIGDFGLAKLNPPSESGNDNTQLTMTGAALGTPMYSAPEQLTGDLVDHRADIYALGATLFHALAGQTPFQTDSVSKLVVAKITGESPRLDLLPDSLDPGVRQLLLHMMEHDPDQRVPDYETLIQRVDQLRQSIESVSGAKETIALPRPTARRRTGRRPLKVALLSSGVVAAILATLALTNVLSKPAVPTMEPSGWEIPLFDGQTLTAWTDRSGLWQTGTDDEGGSILVGKGSAIRPLPDPPIRPGETVSGIGIRLGIDLQKASAAEVHFGFSAADVQPVTRLVARVSRHGVSLGSRQGIDGEFDQTGPQMILPNLSDDTSNYHELRIEMHGDYWFLYFDGKRFGDAEAVPAANNRTIQLVATEGTVHFDGPSVFGLRTKLGPDG